MRYRLSILLLLCCSYFLSLAQHSALTRESMLLKVLKNQKAGKLYTFSTTGSNGYELTKVTYLGAVPNKKLSYKLVTCAFIWGPNRHTNGSIYVFDQSNKELGKYQLGNMYDLPDKLVGTKLRFGKRARDSCSEITYINFGSGLPNELFIRCKGTRGDFYRFLSRASY